MAVAAAGFQAVAAGATAVSSFAAGMQGAANDEAQAALAETQALQRDTLARQDLDALLSSITASRAANGLSVNSPNARILEDNARQTSDRDRLIERANDRQRAENFRASASARRRGAGLSLVTGAANTAVPIAQYGFSEGWFS